MSKYIDADKLIAEIERRMTENCELAEKVKCFGDRAVEDNDILALIESLQQEQPEVDLEQEMKESEQGWYNEAAEFWYKHCELNKTKDQRILILDAPTFTELVHDFYELGKARKEE